MKSKSYPIRLDGAQLIAISQAVRLRRRRTVRVGKKPDIRSDAVQWLNSAIEQSKCVQLFENGSMRSLPGSETFNITMSKLSFLIDVAEWAHKHRILLQRDALQRALGQLRYSMEDIKGAEQRRGRERQKGSA